MKRRMFLKGAAAIGPAAAIAGRADAAPGVKVEPDGKGTVKVSSGDASISGFGLAPVKAEGEPCQYDTMPGSGYIR